MAAMAAVLCVNGCTEIENLLSFCEIPRDRIRVEEAEEFVSHKVWEFWVFNKNNAY